MSQEALRVTDDGKGGVAVAGQPAGWEAKGVPGLSVKPARSVYLSVERGRDAGRLWFGGAQVRRMTLKAVTSRGKTHRVVVGSQPIVRTTGGYEVWRLRLPQTTRFVAGKVWLRGRKTAITLEAEANLPIFRPAPAPTPGTGPYVDSDGSGRPTG